MEDLYIFKYCHPKEYSLPSQFEILFEQHAESATRALKNRSTAEIVSTMRDIDQYINESLPFKLESLELNGNTHDIAKYGIGSAYGRMGFTTLMHLYKKDNKSPFITISNPTWYEIFSIYTLGLIAYAIRDLSYMENLSELNRDDYLNEMAGTYLAEVTETSTIAHFVLSDNWVKDNIDQTITEINKHRKSIASKGGKARSEKYNALKDAVYTAYQNGHTHKSNKQAARDILHVLPEDIKTDATGNSILAEHNSVEQVARWIGQFRRNQLRTLN